MKVGHAYDHFRQEVAPVLRSKLEEFKVLGYETISSKELWEFLTKKKWRNPREDIRLYEIVQDILSVQIGEYMSYASVEAFRLTDFSFDNEEDRKELLK